jgi:hypothetical protein
MTRLIALVLTCLLSGCSYSSNFTCPEVGGAWCKSLSQVDLMIDSGEIEKYYEEKRSEGKCLFGSCGKNRRDKAAFRDEPPLARGNEIKARIEEAIAGDEGNIKTRKEGEYLYVE